MGEHLPVLAGREAARAFEKAGFQIQPSRGKGSHIALFDPRTQASDSTRPSRIETRNAQGSYTRSRPDGGGVPRASLSPRGVRHLCFRLMLRRDRARRRVRRSAPGEMEDGHDDRV